MPEVNFDLLRSKAVQKRSSKFAKEVNKVYPTIYEIKTPEIVEDEPDYEKRIRMIKANIAGRKFSCTNHKHFLNPYVDLSKNGYKLLWYIMDIIEFNSNAVKFTREQAAKGLDVNVTTIDDAIESLCDNDIMCKTDVRSVFVINHNVIFKGNLIDFMLLYKEIFGNIKPEMIDEIITDIDYVTGEEKSRKGRILIKKYISNGKSKSISF